MIMNAQHRKHVSIKCAEIHAPNVIHAVNMLNVALYNIIQPATVQLDGPEIHKFNVTNVSYLSFDFAEGKKIKQKEENLLID